MEDSRQTLTLALVGLGAVHRWHADALRRVPWISISGAYDRDPTKACRLPGVRRVSSLQKLLSENPDAVVVSVPTPDHESVAARILETGTNAFLEKPATLDRSGLERLYATAERSGAILFVAFHDAYGVELHQFRTHLRSRVRADHGPVRRIRSRFTDPYVSGGAPAERLRSLHGSWHDSGVNALSVVCTLEHGFEIESCRMENLAGYGDQTTVATYRSLRAEGPTLTVETDWTRDEKRKETRLEYEGATVLLDHAARTVSLEEEGGSTELFRARSALPRLTDQYVSLFRDLRFSRAEEGANRRFSLQVHGLLFDAVDQASS